MSNLDVSLDDLIKRNKSSSSRNPRPRTTGSGSGSGPGFGSGLGPRRRFPNRASNRPAPYSVHAPESTWDHDMFAEHAPSSARGPGVSGIETGIKLLISNLDYGVSNEDIKELFSEAGDIKRYSIHYDKSGRSKGTAEVIFSRRRDAEAAIKRYNNVQLDGKPMKIEFAGTNIAPPALPPIRNRLYGNPNPAPRRYFSVADGSISSTSHPKSVGDFSDFCTQRGLNMLSFTRLGPLYPTFFLLSNILIYYLVFKVEVKLLKKNEILKFVITVSCTVC